MPEKFSPQPTPENKDTEALLKELNSKETLHVILSYAMKFSPENAEDIAQEVMIKANKALNANQFGGKSKLTTWLYSITKYEALNLLRKQKRESDKMGKTIQFSDALHLKDKGPTSLEKVIRAEEIKKINLQLNRLPPKQQAIERLRLEEDLNETELAERMNLNVGTIKSQTSKGRKRIREALKEEDKK